MAVLIDAPERVFAEYRNKLGDGATKRPYKQHCWSVNPPVSNPVRVATHSLVLFWRKDCYLLLSTLRIRFGFFKDLDASQQIERLDDLLEGRLFHD